MSTEKKKRSSKKPGLHQRNRHKGRYDLKLLTESCKELAPFVKLNEYGDESIDFFNPTAVKTLNKALLQHYYGVSKWNIPENYLCPPVPGRADYIHHIADLISDKGVIPSGNDIKVLDIGTGANCIYPIIGNYEYNWSFVGSDIDPVSIASAQKIINANENLKVGVELRLQSNSGSIFQGIIKSKEKFTVTICNPPFHSSAADALAGTTRKLKNLTEKKVTDPVLNFGGQSNELWCKGGELKFVTDMIFESKDFSQSCGWFTTLVSKEANLRNIYKTLAKVGAEDVQTINMGHGNKTSRIVAWRFENTLPDSL